MQQLGNETITVLRATMKTDAFDNSKYRDWTKPKKTTVRKCSVQPFILSEKYAAEFEVEREHVRQMLRVWCPAGTQVEYTDRIIHRGVEYDVMGIQSVWNHLNGKTNHVALLMRERLG